MGRCRGVPFEFPNILIRLLRSPRRAGGRTNKMMNTNYLNNNYKSNERTLADLLGQLVRGGNNSSPSGFNRGGGGGGGGSMNNYGNPSIGQGGGGGGGGGWGGNAPNDWNQGGGGGFGSGNMMQRGGVGMGGMGGMNMNNVGGGGGFGGMNDGYGGGGSGMNQGNNFMGMSRGNQDGYSNMGMNNGGFGGNGGFQQNNAGNFGGGDGYGGVPPAPRSRGMWVSGAASRSNRNAVPSQTRNNNRQSNSNQGRRSQSGSNKPPPLSSINNRSDGGGALRPVQQPQKRKGPAITAVPEKAKRSTSNVKPTSAQENKTTSSKSPAPRKVLTSLGGRWYQHFLSEGLNPEAARSKAFEHNNKPFVEVTVKKNVKRRRPFPIDPPVIRLAIFATGFPENMLDPEDLSSLEEMIVDEVANSSTESKLQFERLIRRPGMIVIDCINQQSADWLKDIIPKLTNWENPELRICDEEDIPDAHVMTISLPRSAGQEYEHTLALIQSQNSDLVTDSWEWVNERCEGERLIVTIRVDKESHEAIKEKKWKIFYKFGTVEVNFARYWRYGFGKGNTVDDSGEHDDSKEDAAAEDGDKEDEEMADAPSPPPAPIISN